MKKKTYDLVLGLLLLAAFFYGFYWTVKKILDFLPKEISPTTTTIITGALAAVASVASISLGNYFQRRLELERDLREKKTPLYNDIIDFLFAVLKIGNKEDLSEEETVSRFASHTRLLITWGGDDVLKKFSEFRAAFIRAPETPAGNVALDGLIKMEELLFEIRKDLGHKNKNLQKKEILRLFINDIDRHQSQ